MKTYKELSEEYKQYAGIYKFCVEQKEFGWAIHYSLICEKLIAQLKEIDAKAGQRCSGSGYSNQECNILNLIVQP